MTQLRTPTSTEMRICTRCGERKQIDDFYFVSRKLGTRRGQCKICMSELKQQQKNPDWRPSCARCGNEMDRFGMGRRLCQLCFDEIYDQEDRRSNGSHRTRLKPCSACGVKRLRADHEPGTSLCAVCRSIPQSRRKRLRVYNLTPREYVEMLEAQRYRCSICNVRPSSHWHVDHRHGEPMIIRGLICGPCNTMIALARDSSDRLRSAASYLESPPAQILFPGRVAKPESNRMDGWAGKAVPWIKQSSTAPDP